MNRPALELAVTNWLYGSPASIGELKGKTIVLHFWNLSHSNHEQLIRLLNILNEVYSDKGLVCVSICPATAAVEEIKRHIAEQSLSYSIGLDRPTKVVGAKGETFHQFAVGWGIPCVLINSAGEVAGRFYDSELEDRIQTLLAD